jgi:hypothetical protein
LSSATGCGSQDQEGLVWDEVRQGRHVPLDRIERALKAPVEVKPMDERSERRVYRMNNESDLLVVVVNRASKQALREYLASPDAAGEVPDGIWTIYGMIECGTAISVEHIEQSLGPPTYVEPIDSKTEWRHYREKGENGSLVVVVDRESQLTVRGTIITPYAPVARVEELEEEK